MSERAVIVIEFDLDAETTFGPMLDALREAMHNGIVEPRAVHGAIRETAAAVMAALEPADAVAGETTSEGEGE